MNGTANQNQTMAREWILEEARKILKCERVDPWDHFLDLGGDSLVAPVLANRIEAKWGVRPELEDIFTRSFGDLAEIVSAARTSR